MAVTMKPKAAASAKVGVAELIRRHLDRHPRAADTAAGIQRWWIAPTHGEVSLESVEVALAELEGDGVVKKLESTGPDPAYGRGPRFLADAADAADAADER